MIPFIRHLIGSSGKRAVSSAFRCARDVDALEASVSTLSNDALRGMTKTFRQRMDSGNAVEDFLPEALAVVREACRRATGMRPYSNQLAGAVLLRRGSVAEMATGEGKTLVAMMAAYLSALDNRGVHVVTANDYLVERDARAAGLVLGLLDMRVGHVVPDHDGDDRRDAYAADVTYVTGSELGFDHLRDQTGTSPDSCVMRGFETAIVDEIDSVLIDDAGVPLILAGTGSNDWAGVMAALDAVSGLSEGDWDEDTLAMSVSLTGRGLSRVERSLRSSGTVRDASRMHDADGQARLMLPHVHQALRARVLFSRDRDYIVRDGAILLVDRGTGRVLEGRRHSDGLHQAIEAREGVEILPDSVTVASLTYQNLFRLYGRLSGMTGTAVDAADELEQTYGLRVVSVPMNRPTARIDRTDEIHATSADRDLAVSSAVQAAHRVGRPVLVGTPTVERSEALSAAFILLGIPHQVLNARQHANEARLVARAGEVGAVTIATNMAGRGTDIRLGGDRHDEAAANRVRDLGGLLVIGTERHECRRVDDQLRGRAGRQGDPGETVFMVSLEDSLFRRFQTTRMARLLVGSGNEPAIRPAAAAVLRAAQGRCEAAAFETRRNLGRFDDIPARQRRAFHAWRRSVVESDCPVAILDDARRVLVRKSVNIAMPADRFPEQWDAQGLAASTTELLGISPPLDQWMQVGCLDAGSVLDRLLAEADGRSALLQACLPEGAFEDLNRHVLLQALDESWEEHLADTESTRLGIGLRAYAQRNPLHDWNAECHRLYLDMEARALTRAVSMLAAMEPMGFPS